MTGLDSHWCKHSKCCVCTKEKFCGQIVRGYDFVLVSEDELKYRWKNRIDDHRSLMELASMQDAMRYYKERETKEKEMMGVSIKTVDVEKEKEAVREEGYKQGLEEAWEIARKIMLSEQLGGYSMSNLNRIFGTRNFSITNDILEKFSIYEAKEKIEAYEAEKTKPKLGDVVKCESLISNAMFIGILINENEKSYNILLNDDMGTRNQELYKDCWAIEKTGKHFDIQSMLDDLN